MLKETKAMAPATETNCPKIKINSCITIKSYEYILLLKRDNKMLLFALVVS
jgi:hypothetical protein